MEAPSMSLENGSHPLATSDPRQPSSEFEQSLASFIKHNRMPGPASSNSASQGMFVPKGSLGPQNGVTSVAGSAQLASLDERFPSSDQHNQQQQQQQQQQEQLQYMQDAASLPDESLQLLASLLTPSLLDTLQKHQQQQRQQQHQGMPQPAPGQGAGLTLQQQQQLLLRMKGDGSLQRTSSSATVNTQSSETSMASRPLQGQSSAADQGSMMTSASPASSLSQGPPHHASPGMHRASPGQSKPNLLTLPYNLTGLRSQPSVDSSRSGAGSVRGAGLEGSWQMNNGQNRTSTREQQQAVPAREQQQALSSMERRQALSAMEQQQASGGTSELHLPMAGMMDQGVEGTWGASGMLQSQAQGMQTGHGGAMGMQARNGLGMGLQAGHGAGMGPQGSASSIPGTAFLLSTDQQRMGFPVISLQGGMIPAGFVLPMAGGEHGLAHPMGAATGQAWAVGGFVQATAGATHHQEGSPQMPRCVVGPTSPQLAAALEGLHRALSLLPNRGGGKYRGVDEAGHAAPTKGTWLPEEDQVLVAYVGKYGPRNWNNLMANGWLNRSGKSCRLRWVNQLMPGLQRSGGKGCKRFTEKEEQLVLSLQKKFGNKWAQIARHLPGRTDNDVKNFWNLHKKKLARLARVKAEARKGGAAGRGKGAEEEEAEGDAEVFPPLPLPGWRGAPG